MSDGLAVSLWRRRGCVVRWYERVADWLWQRDREAIREKLRAEFERGRARTIRGMEKADPIIMRRMGVADWRDPNA